MHQFLLDADAHRRGIHVAGHEYCYVLWPPSPYYKPFPIKSKDLEYYIPQYI